MIDGFKFRRSWIYTPAKRLWNGYAWLRWIAAGRPVPPPSVVKARLIRDVALRFGFSTLVETGTFWGDMLWAVRRDFRQIYSIELDPRLHAEASRRLAAEGHIRLLLGDSGELLPAVLNELREPTLFWLDAHYSAGITARGALDSPILLELAAIAKHSITGHGILIDDARDFRGTGGYPSLQELESWVIRERPDWQFSVENDVIRILPAV